MEETDEPYYPREIDTELRYSIPMAGPGETEYFVVVAMRGASFHEPYGAGSPLSPLIDAVVEFLQRRYGRRSPVRKVGILEARNPWWSRRRCRYKVWVASLEEADELAYEICAELEQGIRRWK